MSGRTDYLTEFAKPIADKMADRCGSLKKVLSAGVLALDALSPDLRELFMAMASGKKTELKGKLILDQDAELYSKGEQLLMPDKKVFRREVLKILKEAGVRLQKPQQAKSGRKSARSE